MFLYSEKLYFVFFSLLFNMEDDRINIQLNKYLVTFFSDKKLLKAMTYNECEDFVILHQLYENWWIGRAMLPLLCV